MQYLRKRAQSFVYAFKGIKELFISQPNAQIHLVAIVVIGVLGSYVGLNNMEWCLVIVCMALVLVAEGLNTAVEFLTDLASPDFHPLAGKAKDVAAGSVLIAVILGGIVWGIIFLPKLLSF